MGRRESLRPPGPARAPSVVSVVSVVSVALVAALAWGACERPAETRCSAGADPRDRDDACPFGPPTGPAEDPAVCPPLELGTAESCSVTWSDDVYPIFDDPDRGRCTLSGCHGTPEDATRALGVFIPIGDPVAAYEQLSRVRGPGGRPYVAPGDPGAFILCNLEGRPGGGSPMPKPEGRLGEKDLAIVRAWVLCGMPPPSGSGEGGSGGGGSGGGF